MEHIYTEADQDKIKESLLNAKSGGSDSEIEVIKKFIKAYYEHQHEAVAGNSKLLGVGEFGATYIAKMKELRNDNEI